MFYENEIHDGRTHQQAVDGVRLLIQVNLNLFFQDICDKSPYLRETIRDAFIHTCVEHYSARLEPIVNKGNLHGVTEELYLIYHENKKAPIINKWKRAAAPKQDLS